MARLIEAEGAQTDLALVGVYMFNPSIFDAARSIEPSWRGELEITDAIQTLVDRGMRVDPHIVHGWWKDTGQVQDMLEANQLILDDLSESVEGELIDSRVEGRVVIAEGAGWSGPPSAARRSWAAAPASRTPTSAPTRRSATT